MTAPAPLPTAPPVPRITPAGRYFYWASVVTALSIGGLQMYRVHGGWLTDYGADLFGTAWLYAMTRLGRTVLQRGHTMGAMPAGVLIFVLCTASEIAQRSHLFPGRFDPSDILTYAVAILGCWTVERAAPMVDRAPPRPGA